MADGSVVFSTELDDSGLKNGLSKLGGASAKWAGTAVKGVGVALGAVTTGIGAFVTTSLGNMKELEQGLGGSEAVFEDYAKSVQKTGKQAYKKLGLSQSDYLETANKMGSLFKGLGYDTEEAATITMESMQRAADVASLMGIDTAWAMESIAGAAKGNFTMMDNLGVAINETTLANYALKKGIEKSVSKMSTQEKVALALEMFMENTAYATGQYAKENDTLAGSITTLGAAWDNFLAGTGETSVDDLVWSLSNAVDVITVKLQELMPRLKEELPALVEKITPVLSELLSTVLPSLTEMVITLIPPIAKALGEAAKALAPALFEGLLSGILGEDAAQKVKSFLNNLFNPEDTIGNYGRYIDEKGRVHPLAYAPTEHDDGNNDEDDLSNLQEWMTRKYEGIGGVLGSLIPTAVAEELPEEATTANDQFSQTYVNDFNQSLLEAFESGALTYDELVAKMMPSEGFETAEPETGEGNGETNPIAQKIISMIIDGLTALTPSFTQEVATMIAAGEAAADVSGFRDVGYQIASGMASGVKSGQGILVSAVQKIIKAALTTAKKTAKIHSPSQLFRDEIGAMLTQGVAEGVSSKAFVVRKAVNNMVVDSMPDMRRVNASTSALLSGYSSGIVDSARAASYGSFSQTNNFNVPYATPDEVADTMYMYATYGLAAER